MLFKILAAGLATSVSFASAWTQPTGSGPDGNPILLPGLTSIVPAGQPYKIEWTPTTNGTVTLLLLKGPSTNAVPQYAIAESIANSGSYIWTPSTDLTAGTSGYGIELIVDATGQYQYSTQFGISNDGSSAGTTTASASTSASASSTDSPSTWSTTSWSDNSTWSTTSSSVVSTTSTAAGTAQSASTSSSASFTTSSHATISISTSASTAAATTSPSTGAAATVATSFAGLVFAAAVAVLAL